MATKPPNGWRSGPHRPGYKPPVDHPSRKGKHSFVIFFTDDELDAVTKRAPKDGITKQEAGRRLLLHYAKRGLTNG
jgi:hypothetical protein